MKMERADSMAIPAARGPMRGQPVYVTEPSGARRLVGVALRDVTQLEIIVERARHRHEARGPLNAKGEPLPFVPPFTSGQISVARAYRDLVEWREGSPLRCSDLNGSTGGGGGAGLYIDSYIENGRWLDVLRARIGEVVVMDIRRHMDRGNARRAVTARVAVDLVVLSGLDLSAVLTRHGWAAKGTNRDALRSGLCSALDRMSGPIRSGVQVWQDVDVQSQQKGY